MRKVDKKIISIILILIMIISQIIPVIAADYGEPVEKISLEQYLIKNGVDENKDGKLSNEEWKSVKNLELSDSFDILGIEKATNLKSLNLTGIYPDKIDFSKFSNLELLSIDLSECENGKKIDLVLPKLENLKHFSLQNHVEYLKDGVQGYKSLTNNIKSLDISKLTSLEELYLNGTRECNIKLPKLKQIKAMYIQIPDETEIDLTESYKLVDGFIQMGYEHDIYDNDRTEPNCKLNDSIIVDSYTANGNSYMFLPWDNTIECIKGDFLDVGPCGFCFTEIVEQENNILEGELYEDRSCYNFINVVGTGEQKIKFKDSLGRDLIVTVISKEKEEKKELDYTLEKTGITAEFVKRNDYWGVYTNLVLRSNGELWQSNEYELEAKKIATNIKKIEIVEYYRL